MSLPRFDRVHQAAVRRKGGEAALRKLLPKPASARKLIGTPDDRYLSMMAKCVFRSGFVWQIIEHKWPNFETAFQGFDPLAVASLPEEAIDRLAADPQIVRHYRKILSVRENAWYLREISAAHGGFGRFLADWPVADIIGLWAALKKDGSRLGGNTGPYFLRSMGKDSFLLTRDVVACLNNLGVIDRPNPSSKRDLQKIQALFNAWQEETGLPLSQLSRIAACSLG